MQPAQPPGHDETLPASGFIKSHAAMLSDPQTALPAPHQGADPCKVSKGAPCVPGSSAARPTAQQLWLPGQHCQLPQLSNTGPAALHMTSPQPTASRWQTPAARISPVGLCDDEDGVSALGGDVNFASLLAEAQAVSQHYNSSKSQQALAPGWPQTFSSSRRTPQPCTNNNDMYDPTKSSSSHKLLGSTIGDARTFAKSECKSAAHGQARQPAAVPNTGAPTASVSEVRLKPRWDLPMKLCDPDTLMPTGQRVLMSEGNALGSGGFGGVKEVQVKLYGRDSLAAVKPKNQALTNLLQCTPCTCGTLMPGVQQGAACDTSPSSIGRCHCSVRMALKAPSPYTAQPPAVQSKFTPDGYKKYCEKQMWTEYYVMEKCQRSKHIIDVFALGSLAYEGVQQHCLLLELSELGSVEKHYSKMHCSVSGCYGLDDVKTQKLVRQVTAGLSDLHQLANSIHRDVNWGNLLLSGNLDAPSVKLCDFGASKVLAGAGNYGHTAIGTLEWAAPEQADSRVGQDCRLDTYQLGLLVLALRTGRMPLWWVMGKSPAERAQKLLSTLDNPGSPYNDSDNYKHGPLGAVEKAFVKRCLQEEISRRPSAMDLLYTDPYMRRSYAGN